MRLPRGQCTVPPEWISAVNHIINLRKTMQNTDRSDVPVKTQDEKLASIDSSIESCIEILRQEIFKRHTISFSNDDLKSHHGEIAMLNALTELRAQFLAIKPEA